MKKFILLHLLETVFSSSLFSQTVSTFAGSGVSGSLNAIGILASFSDPEAVCTDRFGNVYVGDVGNQQVRKITPAGLVSVLAGAGLSGSVDGSAGVATFYYPRGLCSDTAGNIFVADEWNHKIRKITPAGIVSTLAGSGMMGFNDGPGFNASFHYPVGICTDLAGNIFVSESSNIRKITPGGNVSTLAGSGNLFGYADGIGSAAKFSGPRGLCADKYGNIYVADFGNHRIRKITPTGAVSTIAGTGVPGSADGGSLSASFYYPISICLDSLGNLYVADAGNNKIRKINTSGIVSTLAGSGASGAFDGPGPIATFNSPWGICNDANGIIYIADNNNHKIRKFTCQVPIPPLNTTPFVNSQICAGNSLSLSAQGTGTLSWYFTPQGGTPFNSGTTFFNQYNPTAGTYTYYVENQTCTESQNRTAITFTISDCLGLSTSHTKPKELRIYPNPGKGVLNLLANDNSPKTIEISDVSGTILYSQISNESSLSLDLTGLSPGIYFLRIRRDIGTEIFKLIRD